MIDLIADSLYCIKRDTKIGTGTIEKPYTIILDLYSLLNCNYRSLF
jgi:hypothetical protein